MDGGAAIPGNVPPRKRSTDVADRRRLRYAHGDGAGTPGSGAPLLRTSAAPAEKRSGFNPLSALSKTLKRALSKRSINMALSPSAKVAPGSRRASETSVSTSAWGNDRTDREFFHAADADLKQFTPWYIILPSDGWKQVWDMLIVLLVFYSAIVIPLNVGFSDPDCTENCNAVSRRQFFDLAEYDLDIVDTIADVVFGIDIVLSFFTAYIHTNGRVEFKLAKIAGHYIWPFFFVDLFSVFPFELVVGSNTSQIALTKILKLPRLVRLSRLWRYFENFRHANIWRVFRLLIIVLMVSHWVLCGFHFVVLSATYPDTTWVVDQLGRLDANFSERYFGCMHAVFLMLYGGDPQPSNEREKLYSSMMRLLGAVITAAVFGNVAMLLANQNAASLEWRKEMDQVNQSMRSMDIAPELQERIRAYFEYVWLTHGGSSGKKWMWMLTDTLHANLLMHINQHMISKVKIFRSADPRFVMAIILKFENKLYLPGDFVIVAGTVGKEMYFVAKGMVEILADVNGSERLVTTLHDGDYFGEIALLSRSRRTASARAKTYVELNMLSREDFDEVCAEFPRDARILRDVARSRLLQLQAAAAKQRHESVATSVVPEARRSFVGELGGTRAWRGFRACCVKLCGAVFTNPMQRELNRMEELRRQQAERHTLARAGAPKSRASTVVEEKGLMSEPPPRVPPGPQPARLKTKTAFLGSLAATTFDSTRPGRLPPLQHPHRRKGSDPAAQPDTAEEADADNVRDPFLMLVAPSVRSTMRAWARKWKAKLAARKEAEAKEAAGAPEEPTTPVVAVDKGSTSDALRATVLPPMQATTMQAPPDGAGTGLDDSPSESFPNPLSSQTTPATPPAHARNRSVDVEELYSPSQLSNLMTGLRVRESRKSMPPARHPPPDGTHLEKTLESWMNSLSSSLQSLTETVQALQDRQDMLAAHLMGSGATAGRHTQAKAPSRFTPAAAFDTVAEAPLREAVTMRHQSAPVVPAMGHGDVLSNSSALGFDADRLMQRLEDPSANVMDPFASGPSEAPR